MDEPRTFDPVTDRAPLDAFAWPGGYSILYVAEDGGAALCAAHAWQCIVQRDEPMVSDTYDEGPPVQCEGDYSIPHYVISSYGDPDAPEDGPDERDSGAYPEWWDALKRRGMAPA